MLAKVSSFPWFGGKFFHRGFILPLLPLTSGYCEPFAGAATLLINRPRSEREILNDINPDICNFFEVLRDHPDALIQRIVMTPYARDELARSVTNLLDGSFSPVERARSFYTMARQSMSSAPVYTLKPEHSDSSWRGMYGGIQGLKMNSEGSSFIATQVRELSQRIQGIQVVNGTAEQAIQRYDAPDMLFYCDPPYVTDTRNALKRYGSFEMDDKEHRELAYLLNRVQARVAVSGYRSELYFELYRNWHCYIDKPKTIMSSGGVNGNASFREEVIWTNYDAGLDNGF